MDGLEQLVEIEAIKRLKADYFDHVDSKRWDAWGSLFSEDCVAIFEDGASGIRCDGRSALVELVSQSIGTALTIHRGTDPRIDILSATEAQGIWAMQDWLHWPDGVPLPQGVRNIEGWGHYHETYGKSAAGWRIRTLKLIRQHLKLY